MSACCRYSAPQTLRTIHVKPVNNELRNLRIAALALQTFPELMRLTEGVDHSSRLYIARCKPMGYVLHDLHHFVHSDYR